MKNTFFYNLLKSFVLVHVAQWMTPLKDKRLPDEVSKSEHFLKISYCTTCMGRTFHLKKTYLKNIIDNIDYPNIEFILINYNSKDDMDEWVNSALKEYIDDGIVKYYRTYDPEQFHPSKAKNLAHRLASGDILVNLDADNFLGKKNAFYTNYYFHEYGPDIILRFSKNDFRYFDSCGRIALTSADFKKVGGYREDLLPYGEEDLDLIRRVQLLGHKNHNIEIVNFLRTVKHTNTLRKANLGQPLDLKKMREQNYFKIKDSIEKKEFKANASGFTSFKIFENFNDEPVIIES